VLREGMLPVLASVAADARGRLLNVNADAAAAAMASAVRARRLIFLTDVEGLMDGDGRVIDRIDAAAARRLIDSGAVEGGMRPKLAACLEAVAAGVPEVLIAGPSRHGDVLKDGRGGTCLVAA
jgi:acetylglutamate kinase